MIHIFSADQYLEEHNIEESLTTNLMNLLDQIISLEIAIFHMRNTNKPKFCDGSNIDNLINLKDSKISYFESLSSLTYSSLNDYLD